MPASWPSAPTLPNPLHCAQCRELIHNHGKIFVKRGEWVHDKSKDAEKIEAVFASLAARAHAANVAV